MRKLGLALTLGLFGIGHAIAADSIDVAEGLGNVLGVEKHCGISFDQAAVARYVEKTVDDGDAEFLGYLDTYIYSADRDFDDSSITQQTVICTQARRTAKAFGILAD